jgi:hypothetical protein
MTLDRTLMFPARQVHFSPSQPNRAPNGCDKQAVHIISDGAFCDASGIVREIGPSVFGLPHLPAALAIRGSSHFMPFLVHRLSRECRSLDDLLAKIVSAALEVHISFPMTFGTLEHGTIEPDFDLVVVGWSKSRGGPASYLADSPATLGSC